MGFNGEGLEMKKSLTRQLKEAKEQIKRLGSELEEVKKDRELYRTWMTFDFKNYIEMAGKNQYWSSDTMITKITKRLQQAKTFYW